MSEKLNCPVIKTVSTSAKDAGLKEVVVKAAVALKGKGQKAPYVQADIDLHDKDAVDREDRKRFASVNKIVKAVEKRQSTYKRRDNHRTRSTDVLTNKVVRHYRYLLAVMYGWYSGISQSALGPLIADWLVGWIETFQGWVSDSA